MLAMYNFDAFFRERAAYMKISEVRGTLDTERNDAIFVTALRKIRARGYCNA
jgi:hypothetical protein